MGEKLAASVDLSAEQCPVTYVCAAIALEKLRPGELVEFWLGDEEAARDVPRSLENDGHLVTALERRGDRHRMVVRKLGATLAKEEKETP